MEFESPDVEKDFPGLYASEAGKKSNESDFSDDAHERPSKKDLLIGKRKDKKDSKKDRGYAALEGESSPEEDPEMKSPSKSKKSKSFKFPSKKEKREKSREKDGKEKEKEADKDKKKDKEGKVKLKLKERKKSKHGEDCTDAVDEQPVFGVPLELAVERSRCHDGVDIPLVVRDCIDYVQENGLNMESIYKLSGIKSKVQNLRRQYNLRETVSLAEYEPPVVTSLLKQFFRELPEPLLTTDLLARFEEAAAANEVGTREADLQALVEQLPTCNRHLLGWLMVHLDCITIHEKVNKMNAQNLAISLSPVLQMSHRLFTAILCHCKALFTDVKLSRYVPPLSAGSPSLPDTAVGIADELRKQESLLNQIHREMNAGYVSKRKEEQLWEVQRLITQLKRKLRTVQRAQEMSHNQKSLEEDRSSSNEFRIDTTLQKARSCSEEDTSVAETKLALETQPSVEKVESVPAEPVAEPAPVPSAPPEEPDVEAPEQEEKTEDVPDQGATAKSEDIPSEGPEPEEELLGLLQEETVLQLEQRELLSLQADLRGRLQGERAEIERLRAELATARTAKYNYSIEDDSSEGSSSPSRSEGSDSEDPEMANRIEELRRENLLLQQKKSNLVRRIVEEREACLHLRVQLSLLQLSQESKQL
ncbi:ralA-binding protein 1 isoform X2 [Anabrus simplex]|uniref:ralA-binding protein 1 isoform X2 n=1 Tax=Anabrus simplex TaxID=316456 RepID=UPI0035A32BF9